MNSEEDVKEYLKRNPPYWCSKYPKLVAEEWHVNFPSSQDGIGDLVFSDASESKYLVVEVKYLNPRSGGTARASRNYARQKVEEQAKRYGKEWARRCTGKEVKACGYLHADTPELAGPWLIQEATQARPLQTEQDAGQGWLFSAIAGVAAVAATTYLANEYTNRQQRRN
ncbi:hypothetical protein MP638_000697 [Amoeboaphelidium occidentale]|nr:hypothetical protein MP638_000697 [Amoeboaphelidium occidentale]